MTTSEFPPPVCFGLPDKFDRWRPNQAEACELMLSEKPRFTIAVCPTGFGKSLTYITAALASGKRAVILTSTKGLQNQLISEFGGVEGIMEIKGRSNYTCRLNSKVTCETGLCAFGVKCSFREQGGCEYYDKVKQAKSYKTRVVITNYAYWMSQNEYSTGLGKFDLLILDEAHDAVDHLNSHVSVQFNLKAYEGRYLKKGLPQTHYEWKMWAMETASTLEGEIEATKLARKEKTLITLMNLEAKVRRLAEGIDQTWVWSSYGDQVTISPLWPAPFKEILFLGIPNVVLTSATIVLKTADLLGIPKEDLQHVEFPHSFEVERRPFIHTPTVKMNFRNGEGDKLIWLNRMDAIISKRLGTKGIIHTTSYDRRDVVCGESKFKDYMITHSNTTTQKTVEHFKVSPPPAILVSPSMVTGWDFPGDECRWQIIIKLPYPDLRDNIVKKRGDADKDYINYQVVQRLIQATGRGCRSETDYCETFILDNNITWFMDRNSHLFVSWFDGAYRMERVTPQPLIY